MQPFFSFFFENHIYAEHLWCWVEATPQQVINHHQSGCLQHPSLHQPKDLSRLSDWWPFALWGWCWHLHATQRNEGDLRAAAESEGPRHRTEHLGGLHRAGYRGHSPWQTFWTCRALALNCGIRTQWQLHPLQAPPTVSLFSAGRFSYTSFTKPSYESAARMEVIFIRYYVVYSKDTLCC